MLAVVLVIVGSLLPGNSIPMRELARLHINDKVQHFGAYAALAFLPAIHEKRKLLILAALGLVALGVLLEFGQMLSAGRFFEIGDMVADTAGVCVGAAFGLPLRGEIALDG